MRHPIRGLLIGPMIVPIAYWIGVMAYAWVRDFRLSWFQALRELLVIAAFGLPIAYAAALFWGVPVLYALYRFGWLRPATVIVGGALGGTIVAAWFALNQQGSLIRVRMPLAGGAGLGALAAGTCWWAGQGKAKGRLWDVISGAARRRAQAQWRAEWCRVRFDEASVEIEVQERPVWRHRIEWGEILGVAIEPKGLLGPGLNLFLAREPGVVRASLQGSGAPALHDELRRRGVPFRPPAELWRELDEQLQRQARSLMQQRFQPAEWPAVALRGGYLGGHCGDVVLVRAHQQPARAKAQTRAASRRADRVAPVPHRLLDSSRKCSCSGRDRPFSVEDSAFRSPSLLRRRRQWRSIWVCHPRRRRAAGRCLRLESRERQQELGSPVAGTVSGLGVLRNAAGVKEARLTCVTGRR